MERGGNGRCDLWWDHTEGGRNVGEWWDHDEGGGNVVDCHLQGDPIFQITLARLVSGNLHGVQCKFLVSIVHILSNMGNVREA